MQIKTFKEAEKFLLSLDKSGIRLGLESTLWALKKLSNPHKKFKSILVAGTNGKGSTVTMISAVLKETGYKVGSFISPHVLDVRERIQLGGAWVSKKDFVRLAGEVYQVVCKSKNKLTYFEFLTVMAFLYFYQKKVDFAVVEVGLGGRWDASNVLNPLVSVITSIGKDHQKYLGNTLEKIAKEKAGIIKSQGTCVTGVSHKDILAVIRKRCKEVQSKLIVIDPTMQLKIPLSLKGGFQKNNALCALATLHAINNKGHIISPLHIKKGFQNAYLPGRFEKVSDSPTVILDGAHNGDGIKALVRSLDEAFPGKKVQFVVGILKDKNYSQMIECLSKKSANISFAKLSSERSLDESVFSKKFKTFGSIREALPHVYRQTKSDEVVCVTGSLYAVGDAKGCFL